LPIITQALHQRADHLDRRLRQFRKRYNGLLVSFLFGEAGQGGLVELAVFLQLSDEALCRREIAHLGHFAVGAGRRRRNGTADFLEQMRWRTGQQFCPHRLRRIAKEFLAQL